MSRHPLDDIRVANPCPVSWDSMFGDERVRFCSKCKLNVYNLSGMNRREAMELVSEAEGKTCVRFFRRKDGTVLTENCPIRRSLASFVIRIAVGVLASAGVLFGSVIALNWRDLETVVGGWGRSLTQTHQLMGAIEPPRRFSDNRDPQGIENTEGDPGGTPPSRGRREVR